MVRYLYERSLDDLQDTINALSFCCADMEKQPEIYGEGIFEEDGLFELFGEAITRAFKNGDDIFIIEGKYTGIITFVKKELSNNERLCMPGTWVLPYCENPEDYKTVYKDLMDVAARNLNYPFGIYANPATCITKENLDQMAKDSGIRKYGEGKAFNRDNNVEAVFSVYTCK